MAETLVVEALGFIHLMVNGKRRYVKFVNTDGPHTSMILSTDSCEESEEPPHIGRHATARLRITVEYEDEEYSLEMVGENLTV